MIQFLVYLVIILTVVAIAQLVRVFELSAQLKGESSNEITEEDNRSQAKMWMVFMIAFFAFCFWQMFKYKDKLLPISASEHGVGLDWLMNFNFLIIGIVFVITNIFLFYFAYKYYGRKDSKATFYPHNNKLEMIWTIVPAIVLAIIIVLGLKSWNNIMQPSDPNAMVVELYAKQFDWTARYSGKDNLLGAASHKLITGTNAVGLDSLDSPSHDDIIVKNEIHLPVGREVEFKFRSRDVIHSAYFPHFRAQMNCVPGMTTMFHFTPTITTAEMRKNPGVVHQQNEINELRGKRGEKPEEFNYILLCNKICGASHYNMQMTIVVETPEEYEKWITSKKPFFGVNTTAEGSKVEEKVIAQK
jgi:cytochrome c oxidase subunit 2